MQKVNETVQGTDEIEITYPDDQTCRKNTTSSKDSGREENISESGNGNDGQHMKDGTPQRVHDKHSDDVQQGNKSKNASGNKGPQFRKKKMTKSSLAKHYQSQHCPVCGRSVVHLRRHILEVHMKKNQKLPLFRLEALVQMGKVGESLRGKKRKEKTNGNVKVYKGRSREICPLCEKVQLYLSTHLRRVHNLRTDSSQYKAAIESARCYQGVSEEIKYDKKIHQERKRKASSDDDSDLEPKAKKQPNSYLSLLIERLADEDSESGDEDFDPNPNSTPNQMDVLPPTPQPSTSRSAVCKDKKRKPDFSEKFEDSTVESAASGQEENEDEDVEGNDEEKEEGEEEISQEQEDAEESDHEEERGGEENEEDLFQNVPIDNSL